jgi:argininosuccinate lyase
MPTTPASWALGYAELLLSDVEAVLAARAQVNVSPLGSAAGYGVPTLALPREAVAERLGFSDAGGPRLQTHVAATQLSRGKIEAHVLFALAQVGATINRLAADLVLFASAEFGFVRMPREYTTGSSIMPQKRNPDVAELARGAYHRLSAELHLLLQLPANLPSGYHRDLQLTKEAVMRGTLRAGDLLAAMNHLVPGLSFDEAKLARATTPELFATAHALGAV